jgi:uncharacterized protein (DUF1778 family)
VPGGRPKSSTEWHYLSTRVSVDEYRAIERAAAAEGVSVSRFARVSVTERAGIVTSAERITERVAVLVPESDLDADAIMSAIHSDEAVDLMKMEQTAAEVVEPDAPPSSEVPWCTTPSGLHPSSRRVGSVCMVCRTDVGTVV